MIRSHSQSHPQSHVHPALPKPVLLGAAALVAFVFATTGAARLTGVGRQVTQDAPIVDVAALSFVDRDDGSILVREEPRGDAIATIAPETNGFLRSTLRGLVRERRRAGVDSPVPFTLSSRRDGAIEIADPATGRRVELTAFGPTNSGAFAALLDARRRIR